MENAKATLLEQAKQGDAKAIAALLNHKLQPKGIKAKASIKNGYLHIMLESLETPDQESLVDFIRRLFLKANINTWHVIRIYGKQVDEEIPEWAESLQVALESNQNLIALAQQRNTQAIAVLISQYLQPNDFIVKVSLRDTCLQVMLEASETPDKQRMIPLLQAEIQKIEIYDVSRLRLYGKQSGEEFPDWQEEIELLRNSCSSQPNRLPTKVSSLSSKSVEQDADILVFQENDAISLSNQLYTLLQTTCYQHLAYKVGSEAEKSIHKIVEDFIDNLEIELRLELEQFSKQVIIVTEPLVKHLDPQKVKDVVYEATTLKFTGVRLAIKDLERVTQEVLQTRFPQESDALKSFFSGATQEFAARMVGMTTMSNEAIIGTVIGSIVAPGVGSVIGAVIGGWMGGNKQKKAIEELVEKYQKARDKLFQEWDSLLQSIFDDLSIYLASLISSKFLSYKEISQATDFCNIANNYLKEDPRKAIEFYDKAIQINSGFLIAWNSKGYALNRLEEYEEALCSLKRAIQISPRCIVVLNNYAEALRGLGRDEEAIATYEKSIELEPNNYEIWWSIGVGLYKLNRYKKVIEIADKLLELDSSNFLGWYAKAACQSRMGYSQQALENLREAIRLDSNSSQRFVRNTSDFENLQENEIFKTLMETSVGINYAFLREHLKQRQWHKADQETARIIREIVQKSANSKEINIEALKFFPCIDLDTINTLWFENSDGHFGFNVQKGIYKCSYGDRNTFGDSIGWCIKDASGSYLWRRNQFFEYDFETAPRGHLPSSLWAGEDGWFENRRDRLIALFERMDACLIQNIYENEES